MSSGNWLNKDNLFLQYGTSKAVSEVGGEYHMPGANRVIEVDINLALLNTSTATIVSYTEFFPSLANIQIEKVEAIAMVAMSTSSSPTLSVGVIGTDQATVPSNGGTAFISSGAASTLSTAGDLVTYTYGSTAAGNYVGAYESSGWTTPQYLTATLGTATATGTIRVRIYYHGVGTISN